MGIWSWLFPSDEDRLRRARTHMAAGRFKKARAVLMRCQAPEAESLYDQCSAMLDKEDRANVKQQLASEGFHGFKIEVSVKGKKLRAELERLIVEELERGGVDIGLPDVDEKAFKSAVTRAQRRARGGGREAASVRLVPIVDESLARRLAR